MNPTSTRVPRHRADTLDTPNGPIARALLRAAGLTPKPSGRHAADPPAVMGVGDVDPDVVEALAHRTQVAS